MLVVAVVVVVVAVVVVVMVVVVVADASPNVSYPMISYLFREVYPSIYSARLCMFLLFLA